MKSTYLIFEDFVNGNQTLRTATAEEWTAILQYNRTAPKEQRRYFIRDSFDDCGKLLYLSCCYIEEACIPFLIKDPVRVILSTAIGGALTGGLCLMLSLESPALHGGVFAIPLTSNPLLFIGLWFLGSVVTGIIYATIKKPLLVEEQES